MHEQKTSSYEEYKKEQEQKIKEFKALPFEERLKKTVEKMVYIVRGRTGASKVYAEMLLSMFPNSTYKVCINYWLHKSDKEDEDMMVELMQRWNEGNKEDSPKWLYEKIARPYAEELEEFVKAM